MATQEEINQMIQEAIANSLEEQNQSLKEQNDLYEEQSKSLNEIIQAEEKRRSIIDQIDKLSKEMASASMQRKPLIDKEISDYKKQRLEIENTFGALTNSELESLKSKKAAIDEGKKSMSDFLAKIGINNAWDDSLFGKLENSIKKGDLRNHLSGFADDLSEFPQKLGGSMMMKAWRETINLAKAQDTATAALSQATGAGDKYDKQIQDVYMSNRRFGASFDDAKNSISSMYEQVPKFDDFSQGTRDGLLETSILLDKLGISTENTAKQVGFLTTTFGMSGDKAGELVKELVNNSEAGKTLKQRMADLIQNSGKLAVYSIPKLKEVFIGLSAASKNLQIDMSRLIDITEQFDTFDDAAEMAGKFNALMGSNFIDPSVLINLTDMNDRLAYLAEQTRATGVSFQEMEYYEKKALAKTMGITVEELGKIWGKTRSELMAYNEEQETMEKRAKDAVDVQKKWNSVQETFAIAMGPAIDLLAQASEWYLQLDNDLQKVIGGFSALGIGVGALGAPIIKMGANLIALKVQTAATVGANTAIAASSGPAAAGITTIGKAVDKAGPGLLKLSGYALALGASIGLAGAGMYGFGSGVAKIFESLEKEKVEALGSLFFNVAAFAPAAVIAVPATVAFTAALAGMSAVVDQFDGEKLASLAELTSNFSDLKSENVEIYTRAVRETTQLYKAAKESGITNPAANFQAQTPSQKFSAPFVIKLDERELGNFVVEIVNGEVGILSRD